MRSTVHGHRDVYTSEWVRVSLDDVEIPGDDRFEHHVVHFPRASVTAVVTDDDGRVLLLWRHRFITGSWGWEVPAGWADDGEDLDAAIRREIEEETGYRPRAVREMLSYNALSGISDMRFTAFAASEPISWGHRLTGASPAGWNGCRWMRCRNWPPKGRSLTVPH